jgi:hypothetical protein
MRTAALEFTITAALVLGLFGLNACSNAIVGANFNSSAAVSTPASAGTVTVVSTGGGAAAVAGALAFAALMDADYRTFMEMRSSPSFSSPYGAFWARPVPELDPDRKVSEQDCTKPLDLSQGNIRCR